MARLLGVLIHVPEPAAWTSLANVGRSSLCAVLALPGKHDERRDRADYQHILLLGRTSVMSPPGTSCGTATP